MLFSEHVVIFFVHYVLVSFVLIYREKSFEKKKSKKKKGESIEKRRVQYNELTSSIKNKISKKNKQRD